MTMSDGFCSNCYRDVPGGICCVAVCWVVLKTGFGSLIELEDWLKERNQTLSIVRTLGPNGIFEVFVKDITGARLGSGTGKMPLTAAVRAARL